MQYADEFNAFDDLETTRTILARVLTACKERGREAGSLRLSVAQTVCVGRDEAEVRRRADAIGMDVDELRQAGLAGTPAEVVDKIGAFSALGVSRVYAQVLDLDDLDHIALIASDVATQVAG